MVAPLHTSERGDIYRACAEDVYPSIADGSVGLVISDGPYNMRKAAWDRFSSWESFREWYRPHVEAWGRACAESATLYVWGTDESASELRPLMREAGWSRKVRITWDKCGSPAAIGGTGWADATEVADVYHRGTPVLRQVREARKGRSVVSFNVWRLQVSGSASPLSRERIRTGALTAHRLASRRAVREALHPCQKPLDFYRRMIEASTDPGATVLEPFGGTCRAAFACEALPETDARQYICIEPDADGRDYLGTVVALLTTPGQRQARSSDLFDGRLNGTPQLEVPCES